jgi:hypothetical protein
MAGSEKLSEAGFAYAPVPIPAPISAPAAAPSAAFAPVAASAPKAWSWQAPATSGAITKTAEPASLPPLEADAIEDEIERFRASKISDSGFLAEVLAPGSSQHSAFRASQPQNSLPDRMSDSDQFDSLPPLVSGNSAPAAQANTEDEDNLAPGNPPSTQAFKAGKLRKVRPTARDAGPTSIGWTPSAQGSQLEELESSLPPELQDSLPESGPPRTAPAPLPSFVAQAQAAARWRSPWARAGLSLVGLVLMAALLLQIALHQRDAIAAIEPRARPLLEQLCRHAGCQIQPLKMIEALVVDASSFSKISKNDAALEARLQSYRLSLTLKNNGTLPVALPHVELSLQDAQDKPLLRRVLSPADLGLQSIALAAGQDVTGNLTLQVETQQLSGERISGYRVYAFYP